MNKLSDETADGRQSGMRSLTLTNEQNRECHFPFSLMMNVSIQLKMSMKSLE